MKDVTNALGLLGTPIKKDATPVKQSPGQRLLRRDDTVDFLSKTPRRALETPRRITETPRRAAASVPTGPPTFLEAPCGERLELSEARFVARRINGIGKGIGFVGPLHMDKGTASFQVEIIELEAKSSQTMAIGICCELPSQKPLRAERAKDIGRGTLLLGYDLPKFYCHGNETEKIQTKEWRPIKELAVGDIVGLQFKRASMELSVFVNGQRKVTVTAPATDDHTLPTEVWGVVDVCGNVRAVKLTNSADSSVRGLVSPSLCPPTAAAVTAKPDPKCDGNADSAELSATQDANTSSGAPSQMPNNIPARESESKSARESGPGSQAVKREADASQGEPVAKRLCLPAFSMCSCHVHLISHAGSIVHVAQTSFLIGRNPKTANLTLQNPLVPNMVSRAHARIISSDDGVEVVDSKSLNGTWVNGERVTDRRKLLHGDVVIIGDPGKGPADFRFNISLPPPA